jgi:hypothetical protein
MRRRWVRAEDARDVLPPGTMALVRYFSARASSPGAGRSATRYRGSSPCLAVAGHLRALDVDLLGVFVVLAPELGASDREEQVVALGLQPGAGRGRRTVDRAVEVTRVALALPDEHELLGREALDPVHAVEGPGPRARRRRRRGCRRAGTARRPGSPPPRRRSRRAGDGPALQVALHGASIGARELAAELGQRGRVRLSARNASGLRARLPVGGLGELEDERLAESRRLVLLASACAACAV